MGSTLSSYEIARSGLVVNERGLYVTGHNVANVNTPGYVRQQAMIKEAAYENIGDAGQLGLGASLQQIRQVRHSFLDNIYRKESNTLGYWEAKNKTFKDIEAILAEPMGNGLQTVMNQFWDSWQELSKDPQSLTVRALVRQRGQALVQHINHLGSQLDKLQEDLNSEVTVRIDEINDITKNIASLNEEIARAEGSGDKANDYRDQRNVLIDRLSEIANTDIVEAEDGKVSVYIGDNCLVNGAYNTELYAGKSKDGGLLYIPMVKDSNKELTLNGGTLKGLLDARGQIYPAGTSGSSTVGVLSELKDKLNNMINTMVKEVNSWHCKGYTLGNKSGIPDGKDFFTAINQAWPMGMDNIKLNDNLIDLNNLVASASGDIGDNTIALKIANLRNESLISDEKGVQSLDEYYQSIILDVGNDGASAQNISENQSKLVQSADNQRQSITGVSMDEEMTTMMKYKFAYNASSRAINVIDKMMETIIEKMGIVGR